MHLDSLAFLNRIKHILCSSESGINNLLLAIVNLILEEGRRHDVINHRAALHWSLEWARHQQIRFEQSQLKGPISLYVEEVLDFLLIFHTANGDMDLVLPSEVAAEWRLLASDKPACAGDKRYVVRHGWMWMGPSKEWRTRDKAPHPILYVYNRPLWRYLNLMAKTNLTKTEWTWRCYNHDLHMADESRRSSELAQLGMRFWTRPKKIRGESIWFILAEISQCWNCSPSSANWIINSVWIPSARLEFGVDARRDRTLN